VAIQTDLKAIDLFSCKITIVKPAYSPHLHHLAFLQYTSYEF